MSFHIGVLGCDCFVGRQSSAQSDLNRHEVIPITIRRRSSVVSFERPCFIVVILPSPASATGDFTFVHTLKSVFKNGSSCPPLLGSEGRLDDCAVLSHCWLREEKLSRGQSFAKLCLDSRQGERTFDPLRLGAQDWLVRLPDGSLPQNMKKENPWNFSSKPSVCALPCLARLSSRKSGRRSSSCGLRPSRSWAWEPEP